MKQFDKIKKDIASFNNELELAGYLEGLNVASLLWCKKFCPNEVINKNEISITGMTSFLEHNLTE